MTEEAGIVILALQMGRRKQTTVGHIAREKSKVWAKISAGDLHLHAALAL